MDINALYAALFCHVDEPEKVLDVAVNAAVGQKSHKVQSRVLVNAVFHRVEQDFILEKVAVLDRLAYLYEHLINDPARADVRMADLAVAHLPVGKTDVKPRGAERAERTLGEELAQIGRFRRLDGVAFDLVTDAEAVHYA